MMDSAKAISNITFLSCPSEHAETSTLVVIPDGCLLPPEAAKLATELAADFMPYVLSAVPPPQSEVFDFVARLSAELARLKIKRATVCGFGSGGTVAQALALMEPKFVRRLILLDPTTRVAPGWISRAVDRVERMLPLGLPLRPLSQNFDSRPFLHRLRCPVLILTQRGASDYIVAQSRYIASKVPNSWVSTVADGTTSAGPFLTPELKARLRDFLQAPTKRPQKNIVAV